MVSHTESKRHLKGTHVHPIHHHRVRCDALHGGLINVHSFSSWEHSPFKTMEVTAAPRRPSSFMKSIFMTRPPNNVPSCNATSGQLSLHHHDDPELQEPAVPPDPCPGSSDHHTSCGLSSCFQGLCATRFCRLFCPPRGHLGNLLTLSLTTLSVFLAARTMFGPIAGPGGTVFALLVLILFALIGGYLVKLFGDLLSHVSGVTVSLPPLLGMLVVGILLKNIPYNFGQFGRAECTEAGLNASFVDSLHDLHLPEDLEFSDNNQTSEAVPSNCHPRYIGHELDPILSRSLRTLCLAVILLRAGLELDPVQLWRLSGMVIRATFIPCFVEAAAVAALSHFILGFPWTVGFMLGFVLAAVSPAVIIPCLMSLSERGYGVAKGIPTLVISACAADDVVAISGFGIFLGISFNENADTLQLAMHGPIEVAIGLAFGLGWGLLAQWIPSKDNPNCAFFRWLILFGGGLIALYGAHLIHYDGAGGLAAIILAFVAAMQWRREGWGDHNPVSNSFTKMWIILEPVIFALIGTEIQVDKIDPAKVGLGIVVLLGALAIRMVGTFFAVTCGNLNTREKIFMAFAWMPKATVQAALGPIFLDNALKYGRTEWQPMGEEILTLAVLSILITAPLGAISILAFGPKLLENKPEEDKMAATVVVDIAPNDMGLSFSPNGGDF